MKETITEYEEVEREVEVVYCDQCGTDCTDKHYTQPTELCDSCSDSTIRTRMRNRTHGSFAAGSEVTRHQPPDVLIALVVAPVSLLDMITGYEAIKDISHKNSSATALKLSIFTAIGMSLYTAALMLFLLL